MMTKQSVRLAICIFILGLTACGGAPQPTPEAVPPVSGTRSAVLVPPLESEAREITFEVIDGYAVYEGDILLGRVDGISLQGLGHKTLSTRWPKSVIPFTINRVVNQMARTEINNAIAEFEARTDLDFRAAGSGDSDFIEFTRGTDANACSSAVGRQGGRQEILMPPTGGCGLSTMIHELGHAVGLLHEQARPDRDQFVTVQWNNIPQNRRGNFQKGNHTKLGSYDYSSIMHYGAGTFSSSSLPCTAADSRGCTLVSKTSTPINPSARLSDADVKALRSLYPRQDQSWYQSKAGVLGHGEADDALGRAVAAGDFNNDGFTDMVVGVPFEDNRAGAVNVVYGGPNGLTTTANQLFMQSTSSSIPGSSEPADLFGLALTAGDFNADGFQDLAVGVPGEALGSVQRAGMVNVLYGSSRGLTDSGAQGFSQNTPGVEGVAETGDNFGHALASGDFNADGFADLAVGSPYEAVGNTVRAAGMVSILYGTGTGLTGQNSVTLHQDKPNTPGVTEDLDLFGFSLAVGKFHVQAYDSLAVGVPGEDIGSQKDAGMVQLYFGSLGSRTMRPSATFNPTMSGFTRTTGFGFALAGGNFDGKINDDLAIGLPDAAVRGKSKAGALNVVYSGWGGALDASKIGVWHQDSSGILGMAEQNDGFGLSLSAADFNNDNLADLAVGVPFEDFETTRNTGAVNILMGSGNGLSANGNLIFDQGSPYVEGVPERGDHFGQTLVAGNFDGEPGDDLAVGVPFEDIGSVKDDGMVNVLYYFD